MAAMALSAGVSMPVFWQGLLMILLFAVILNWLPAGSWGDGSLRYLILPVTALALPQLAAVPAGTALLA